MSTVTGTLKMFDAMTGPLKNITQGMNLMISTMYRMQDAADRNISIDKSLAVAKSKIVSAEAQIAKAIEDSTRKQKEFNNAMKNGQDASERLLSSIKGIAATYLSFQGVQQVWGFFSNSVASVLSGDTQERKLAQILNTRMGMDAQQVDDFKKQLKQMSFGHGGSVSYGALIAGAGELGTYVTDQDALLSAMKTASNMAAAQYGLNTTEEQMYNLATGIGKVFSGQAGGLSRQGWILDDSDVRIFKEGTDLQKAATFAALAADSYGNMNAVIAQTPEAKVRSLSELFKDASSSIGNNLLPVVMYASDEIGSRLDGVLSSGKMDRFFGLIGQGLLNVFVTLMLITDGIVAISNFAERHWEIIKPILAAIAFVYLASMIRKLWEMIPPLTLMTQKWIAANWPILLVVAAIALVLYILTQLGVTTDQVVGFMVGVFALLFASIYNQIAVVYNAFIAFAEFLVNLFIDPVYAVKKLFYDLSMAFMGYQYNMLRSAEDFAGGFTKVILQAVNKVLESFNWLVDNVNEMFGSNITKAELFDANNIHAVSDKVQEMMDRLEKPVSTKDVFSANRMEQKNLKDAFDTGYKSGTAFFDKFAALGLGDPLARTAGWDGTLDSVGSVGEVGKIRDTVDISSEDLKTMRELAETQSIQNFVSLSPVVQVTGDNHYSNGFDVDTVIARINQELEEEIASSAKMVLNV